MPAQNFMCLELGFLEGDWIRGQNYKHQWILPWVHSRMCYEEMWPSGKMPVAGAVPLRGESLALTPSLPSVSAATGSASSATFLCPHIPPQFCLGACDHGLKPQSCRNSALNCACQRFCHQWCYPIVHLLHHPRAVNRFSYQNFY